MERLAVIDIGSGKLKMVIGDVNPESGEVLRIVFQTYRKIALARDVLSNPEGELSAEAINRTVEQLNDIMLEAFGQGAKRVVAVATEALRAASNVDKLLKALNKHCSLEPRIVTQYEEGLLGFTTAATHLPEVKRSDIVCWDCGSGSFQITFEGPDELISYCDKLGKVPATKILIEEIQHGLFTTSATANPISVDQMEAFLAYMAERLPPAPDALKAKLASEGCVVAGIGADTSTFGMCATAVGSKTITEPKLYEAVKKLAGSSDPALKDAFQETSGKRILPPLLLIVALMRHLNIAQVRYVHTMGSAAGVLELPEYWQLKA